MRENEWVLDWNRQKSNKIIPSWSKHANFVMIHWMKHDTLIHALIYERFMMENVWTKQYNFIRRYCFAIKQGWRQEFTSSKSIPLKRTSYENVGVSVRLSTRGSSINRRPFIIFSYFLKKGRLKYSHVMTLRELHQCRTYLRLFYKNCMIILLAEKAFSLGCFWSTYGESDMEKTKKSDLIIINFQVDLFHAFKLNLLLVFQDPHNATFEEIDSFFC